MLILLPLLVFKWCETKQRVETQHRRLTSTIHLVRLADEDRNSLESKPGSGSYCMLAMHLFF